MKEKEVKLLEPVMVAGDLRPAGATVTLSVSEANALVRRKKAEEVESGEDERPARRARRPAE